MECGSVGVLRQVGIAPRDREVGDAEGAVEYWLAVSLHRSIVLSPFSVAPLGLGLSGLVTRG